MGTGSCSLGVNSQEHEADHLPASVAEIENGGAMLLLAVRPHGVVLNNEVKH
jgi:hypothetical protein